MTDHTDLTTAGPGGPDDDVYDLAQLASSLGDRLVVPGEQADQLLSPYIDGYDTTPQDDEWGLLEGLGAAPTRSTAETLAFMRNAPCNYQSLCLRLAREGRGIPPLYPSALANQHATPQSNRVTFGQVRRGHVGSFDSTSDGNPYGHIATCAGRTKDGRKLWWTNVAGGCVKLVVDPSPTASYFGTSWGAPFVHGADWINGVEFDVRTGKPKPKPDGLERNEHVRRAVRALREAAEHARRNGKRKRQGRLLEDAGRLADRYDLGGRK